MRVQFNLIPHPGAMPAQPGFDMWAKVELSAAFGLTATLNIWFGINSPAERFVIPPGAEPARADELWRTTCFEVFLGEADADNYREWNFAPSGEWAAYDFTAYRAGMANADIGAAPYIRVEDNLTWWTLGATIALDTGWQSALGLSAVIEERDGTKSYWALAHAAGPPDFHDRDCFIAQLP